MVYFELAVDITMNYEFRNCKGNFTNQQKKIYSMCSNDRTFTKIIYCSRVAKVAKALVVFAILVK